jgi:hypothetical protein
MDNKSIPWIRIAVEFIVVLAGLTFALLFVDWREDRSAESLALQEIVADLEADSVELAAQFNRTQRTQEAVLWILRNRESNLPGDSIFRRTNILNYYTSYEQVSAGYRGLRESGRLSIIRDPELRRQLIQYYEITQPYMKQFYDMYMVAYKEFGEAAAPYVRLVPNPTGDVFVQNFEPHYVRPWREANADYRYIHKVEMIGAIASQFGIRVEPVLATNSELRAAVRGAQE